MIEHVAIIMDGNGRWAQQRGLSRSDGSDGKVSVYNAGDPGLIPGLGRSAGEGNGNPLHMASFAA